MTTKQQSSQQPPSKTRRFALPTEKRQSYLGVRQARIVGLRRDLAAANRALKKSADDSKQLRAALSAVNADAFKLVLILLGKVADAGLTIDGTAHKVVASLGVVGCSRTDHLDKLESSKLVEFAHKISRIAQQREDVFWKDWYDSKPPIAADASALELARLVS